MFQLNLAQLLIQVKFLGFENLLLDEVNLDFVSLILVLLELKLNLHINQPFKD